jgi:hypothetical protein
VTATEDTPISEIVRLMERHRIKCLPVIRENHVVGIVSRANLIRGLSREQDQSSSVTASDLVIGEQILNELIRQHWDKRAPIDIDVRGGIVQLWGPVYDERVARGVARCSKLEILPVKACSPVAQKPLLGSSTSLATELLGGGDQGHYRVFVKSAAPSISIRP